jgi:large subunit ribosomal protein L4
MTKANNYSAKGTALGTFALPKNFSTEANLKLLAQAIYVYDDRAHKGLAKAKTRAEVNRTKKKWYRQKGTGGARHGARSAPIFVGGGVAHGPRPVKRELTLPKKTRKKALDVVLSLKTKEGSIVVLDGLSKIKKTKEAGQLLDKIFNKEKRTKANVILGLADANLEVARLFRNIKGVKAKAYKDFNAYEVFKSNLIALDKNIFSASKSTRTKTK